MAEETDPLWYIKVTYAEIQETLEKGNATEDLIREVETVLEDLLTQVTESME